jgi:FG-GAP-like repeat
MAVLADVNGDGFPDIVTANGFVYKGAGVSVLLGNGDGTFKPAKTIVAGGNPSWIVVGDFNHDGKADIAVANEPDPNLIPSTSGGPAHDSVSILLGNGDGTFRPSIDTPTLGALTMAAADFNGDGKLDLVITTGETSAVQVLLGNGDGTFVVTNTAANGLGFIVTGDFNHDGKKDFLAGFSEMLGNGDGTFTLGPVMPVATDALADFNGDGILDMAAIVLPSGREPSFESGVTSLGSADGIFSPNVLSSTVTSDGNLLAADFNGDGKIDLFGAGIDQPIGGANQLIGGLFLGNGDGTFTQVSAGFGFNLDGTDGVGFPAFAAESDLDNNGSPDVIIANGTGILVALNTFGRPPLLAQVTTDVTFVVGGATEVTGTVALGGPAPNGGVVITLASNNLAASIVNGKTVTVPAGTSSATFAISTEAVTVSTPITISATYHTTKLTTQINLVPAFTVSAISVAPASPIGMFGGNSAVAGTITLSGPASNGTIVKLASANPALLTVPTSVALAPGAKTATFPITVQHVTADTAVALSATLTGTPRSLSVTVKKEFATVVITKAEYVVKKGQLTIQATSTDIEPASLNVGPSLQIYNANTGASLGSLPLVGNINKGVGTFSGQLVVTGPLTSVAAQSLAGGLSILAVAQK